ncbi:hypothetical protein CO154_02775 [Candidatus Pacearchaeota archaeon CG_4_9_14_3_um_filter_31_7]|nr:MAG: hypothetical protein AUJ10_01700 [Candidatus Pacearchaeota archaeon CG1_02_31_27]PIN92610.1 MAG: hypothetical protein COU55_00310 [Candidatus Pacearchaeota archaeon CG10_big_fil_rev_8_21_14_0_10_31_59]PIZ81206.1 MAG: hypothetical protein COX99_00485 [Candidatus Pacearchaeota archaeon CG_4_10_14_0_2_um_filter_31_10]PJA70445.1 MAG: hypothetical protein CO154_02775 [Candidatus Pacearchaeota archaeon CG_4_9_14_3_um_filter_31_7]
MKKYRREKRREAEKENYSEKIKRFLEDIEKIYDEDFFIVVEGKNDIKSLVGIGIPEKKIFQLKTPQKGAYNRIAELVEFCAENNYFIIIFTDFDDEGKKLYNYIKEKAQKEGVKINDSFRDKLKNLKVSHVEGLRRFVERNI